MSLLGDSFFQKQLEAIRPKFDREIEKLFDYNLTARYGMTIMPYSYGFTCTDIDLGETKMKLEDLKCGDYVEYFWNGFWKAGKVLKIEQTFTDYPGTQPESAIAYIHALDYGFPNREVKTESGRVWPESYIRKMKLKHLINEEVEVRVGPGDRWSLGRVLGHTTNGLYQILVNPGYTMTADYTMVRATRTEADKIKAAVETETALLRNELASKLARIAVLESDLANRNRQIDLLTVTRDDAQRAYGDLKKHVFDIRDRFNRI